MDYSLQSKFLKELDKDILDLIQGENEVFNEFSFQELALREYELQYNTNLPYKEACDAMGKNPNNVTKWLEIPAMPSKAFKEMILAAFPVKEAEQALLTSGTTDPELQGKIYRDKMALEIANQANARMTGTYLFPDIDKIRMLLLVPHPDMAPGMGMAYGLNQTRKKFGTDDSVFLVSKRGLDMKTLLDGLKQAEKTGEPVAIVGATSAFIYFFNICRQQGLKFKLPEKSRVCDSGGYSGKFGTCTKDEYFAKAKEIFGLEDHYCINTLGTAENATNFFDNILKNNLIGKKKERYKPHTPWAMTIAVDTETFNRIPKGKPGLLRHYDLANRSTVIAVQTDNIGYETDGGFDILGRAYIEEGRILEKPLDALISMGGRKIRRRGDGILARYQIKTGVKKFKSKDKSKK